MSDAYLGIYKGIVVDNDDPEHSYRVLCQIPQVLGDAQSNWCEPIQPTLFTPRINDIVLVQFLDGDPAYPMYQSRPTVNRETMEPGTMVITGDDIADFSLAVTKFQNNTHYVSPVAMSSNAPTAGSISWGTFNIVYLGQQYTIPAGNTDQKFTWWTYNAGAGGALTSDDSFPAALTDDDTLLFLNNGGIPLNVQATDVMPGDLIVPGSIQAEAIGANQITSDHLSASLSLDVGGILIDPTNGLQIPGPEGTTHFPTDGSDPRIYGTVVTSSINIKNDLTVGGVGQIQGEIDLANGASDPTTKALIQQGWPSFNTQLGTGTLDVTNHFQGLTDYHGNTTDYIYPRLDSGTLLRRMAKATGNTVADIAGSWSSSYFAYGGLTRIGSTYYVLGQDMLRNSGDYYFYSIDGTTGSKTAEHLLGGSNFFGGYHPRIVSNGTQVGMVWVTSAGNLTLRWFNPATWATVGSDIVLLSGPIGGRQSIGDVYWGDAGTGAANVLWVVLYNTPSAFFDIMCWTGVSTTAATRASGNDFPIASGFNVNGMTYDTVQGRMVSLDPYGRMWTYSKLGQTGTTPSIQAAYTFTDQDNSNYPGAVGSGTTVIGGVDVSGTASGTHETKPCPTQTVAIAKRSWPTVVTVPAPDVAITDSTRVDKANRIGLYINNGAAPLFQSYLAVGVNSWTASPANNGDVMPTSGALPTTNTFLSGSTLLSTGLLKSAAFRADGKPKTQIGGDGAANVDGLLPPGSITMFGGTVVPAGWLLCNGQSVPQATYPDLFAAIGTSFGGGSGSFLLPDLRNNFPRGAATLATPGTTGGASTHTHGTSAISVPSAGSAHQHSIAGQSNSAGFAVANSGGVSAPKLADYNGHAHGGATNGGTNDGGHSHNGVSGSTDSASTLPPYVGINFLIKT